MTEPVHIISLGAGVQSSTMALMAAHGEITPTPMACVFADTMAEPASVYAWLDWLEKQLPFPLYRVSYRSLTEDSLKMRISKDGRKYTRTSIPFFMRNPDGTIGKTPYRQCTADFKIKPILKLQRKLGNIKRGQKTVGVMSWIGISCDEITRMKPSREAWAENRWPLIEKNMRRSDCIKWMESHGYPRPPRSACVYCPFHNNKEWLRLKTEEPGEFEKAVQFEKDVQVTKAQTDNMMSTPYLHSSCIPLDQIDFDVKSPQLNFFENDCSGMCGV